LLSAFDRNGIATKIAQAIDGQARDHYDSESMEPHLSSRIGVAIEIELRGMRLPDYKFSIITQDMGDRGAHARESRTGTDLYINISLTGEDGFDKGLFIQAKWDHDRDWRRLSKQCRDMRKITKSSSYVWIYGPTGVRVIMASTIVGDPHFPIDASSGRNVADMMDEVLACERGDRRRGIADVPSRRQALRTMLDAIDAELGLDIRIKSAGRKRR
jgi:hypothetical protein